MDNKRYDSKRRVLQKGETQKREDLYMYRWTAADGSRKCIYAGSLEALREQEEELLSERLYKVSRTTNTLNEQIVLYLKIKANLAPSTRANYEYYFHHAIENSFLGRAKINDIRKSDILYFYKDLSDGGYSPGTINILQKIIHPAMQLACDDRTLMFNPADRCTHEYTDDPEKKYALTRSEEKEFFDRLGMHPRMKRYAPMYAIILSTGMRISEIVGLTWNDVDMKNMEVSVNHQVHYRCINGTTKFYASDPKTQAGFRELPMTDDLYNHFVEQRKIWLATKKDPDFEVDGYRDFVFVSHVTGKCMHHSNIRRMMRTIVAMNDEREIQLPPITPHILRHTACCRLAEAGCDIKVLQYIMGHTDLRTTMRVYNHVDKERVKREFYKLQEQKISTPISTPFTA